MTDIVELQKWSGTARNNDPAMADAFDAAIAEITRLRAASKWQKMADAPMDGTSILVINNRGQFVASWNEAGPDYCLDQFWHVFSGKTWNDLRGSLPIAWQPLPSPPMHAP